MVANKQSHGKRAEFFVFGELLKRGLVPYVPLVDVEGVDAIVRTSQGNLLDIQIKSAGIGEGKYSKWFAVDRVEPVDNFFIICVEAPQGEPTNVWIFPSKVFHEYAANPPKGSPRDLDLDSGKKKFGQPLSEVLCGFKNRWELLIDYEQHKAYFNRPEDLEDILSMKEALESPNEQMITLDEYEQRRKTRV